MSSSKPAATVLKCENHWNGVFDTHNIIPPHLSQCCPLGMMASPLPVDTALDSAFASG